ncbi:hypothetical protein FHX42_004063 [Saccharopolyspora lacisalsi]|uniref:Zn-dependent protease with chaperone function n=1 Tax=Halosaccharopolyspora lacisalsi TaxID=1000566 RepID=A0A839DYW6_9PSEU|nr:M48 family metallopeptidase [Halosaccharopolyspora lacisalsi]MBA8826684.1 hypothetical protein [Halosaccharopolyspora lacisalsi]
MRSLWRAALALALHIGFFALPVALVVGLLGNAAYTYRYDTGNGLRAGVAAAVVTAMVFLGLRAVLRPRARPRGVAIDKSAQPQLWRTISDIADTTGAPAPDRLRITSEPRIVLREDTALLGLHLRSRSLELGLPFVAGLAVDELRTAIAQQMTLPGGNGLERLVHRTAAGVAATTSELIGGPTKWLFSGYAGLYAKLTAPVERDIRFGADARAARVAGKRVLATTLRKTRAIELGWSDYSEEYLSMALSAERTPDLLLGFRSFVETVERKKQLAERAKESILEEVAERNSPSTGERIEAIKRLSASAPAESDDRPGMALVRNPRQTVPELEDRLMVEGMGPRVPWPEMARLAGARAVERRAARLTSAVLQSGVSEDTTLAGVLATIHREQGGELVNPVLNPGMDPEHLDQAVVDTLTELLGAAVVDALVRTGHAQHELDWNGPPNVRLTNGQLLDPDRLVRPAVADPRLVPGLHRTLLQLGVPLDHSQPAADEPEATLAGIVSPVQYASNLYELLVTDRGLLLVPSHAGTAQRLLAGVLARVRRSEHEQLDELERTPVGELRERRDVEWVDSRDVATARLAQRRSGWELSLELYLDDYSISTVDPANTSTSEDELAVLVLGSTADSGERHDPYEGIGELMGARMSVDDQSDRNE